MRGSGILSSAATGWTLLIGVCVTAVASWPQATLAQSAASSEPGSVAQPAQNALSTDSSDSLETVEVTARYVKENIQNTPIAITAESQDQLQAAHVESIATLGSVVPNLWTVPGDSQSAGTPRISMRGVQQGASSSLAAAPAIAIYTDDVYFATTAGSDLDLMDIDHIEVLRGPQSTLSGNASIGGAIKIYTKNPTGDGSGFLSATYGSRNKEELAGATDLAITDTVAVRLSGDVGRQDGFVDRLDFACEMAKLGTPQLAGGLAAQPLSREQNGCVTGELGGGSTAVVQGKLRWRPNDRLDVILTARARRQSLEDTPEIALSYQPNPNPNTNTSVQAVNNATQAAYGIQLGNQFLAPPGNRYATYATNCRPDYKLAPVKGYLQPTGFCYAPGVTANNTLTSLEAHYDISSDVHMTAIAAYTYYDNAFTQNGDQSPLGYVVSHFQNSDYQRSGELRFDGKLLDGRLMWVVGSYLLRLDGYQDNFIGTLALDSYALDKGTISSQSGFFHLDYNITDKWRVSGGARYTDGDTTFKLNNPPLITVPQPFDSHEARPDWLLSTDYQLTNTVLAYVNAGSGSRPPGVTTIVSTAQQLLSTPGESLISYEIGLKSEFFDHHLRANVDAFYTDYKTLATQQGGYQCLGQPGKATWFPTLQDCTQFANAGALQWYIPIGIPAKIVGGEWDITALPVGGLRIDLAGGYTHFASGVETVGAPGYLFPGNHEQPLWNLHADASYNYSTAIGSFTPRVDWSWQSQQDFDPLSNLRAPLPVYVIHPYSLVNLEVLYQRDEKWTATLAVTNVTNLFYYYQPFQGQLNTQTRVGEPRTVLFTLRRDF